jgi:ribonuclease HII
MQQKSANKVDAAEMRRLRRMTTYEKAARLQGFGFIAGIDEAGRGPLAGPVVAAACMIPEDVYISGVNDSKKLLPEKRQEIFAVLVNDPRIIYGIGIIPHEEIDKINIYRATILAMLQAIEQLSQRPDYLLVDGLKLPHPTIPAQKIIQGDAKSQSIAAASILAKVTRDELMCNFHQQWPVYGFDKHKGYATPQHLEAIDQHGLCPIHRKSFAPCGGQVEDPQLDLFEVQLVP